MDGNSTDYPRLARRIAVGMFFFLQGIVFSSWASRIADVKTALGLSDAALGLILLGTPVGQFCTMPFSGYFVSKFGSRKIIRMAAVLYPLALFLMAYLRLGGGAFCCVGGVRRFCKSKQYSNKHTGC
ncbi:MAG: hypothetical protein ACLUKN_14565 [Bacilli bacterium]